MEKTKLTAHQNERITEALCRMAENRMMTPDDIKIARRALVTECEEVNLATGSGNICITSEGDITIMGHVVISPESVKTEHRETEDHFTGSIDDRMHITLGVPPVPGC